MRKTLTDGTRQLTVQEGELAKNIILKLLKRGDTSVFKSNATDFDAYNWFDEVGMSRKLSLLGEAVNMIEKIVDEPETQLPKLKIPPLLDISSVLNMDVPGFTEAVADNSLTLK